MPRNRVKKENLAKQIHNVLTSKLAIGQSKYADKINNATKNKIYSWDTYHTYKKHCNYFTNYCKENYGCKTLEECRPYINSYLISRSRQGLSAWTQKLDAAAIAKLYSCSTKDFVKTDVRHRANITRSRGIKERDKHFSEEKNKTFVDFCKSTGLRRRELKNLTGDKLLNKAGEHYIKINSGAKGGRYREVPIIGNVQNVVSLMKNAGDGKVFDKIPSCDVHGYRSHYCTQIYNMFKRPIETVPHDERYYCRKDLKGTWYDKKAMLIASEALGHSRICVIAESYLRSF